MAQKPTAPPPDTSKEAPLPRYKKRPAAITNEQAANIEALVCLSAKARRLKLLTPTQVAPLIAREPKTMERDRLNQRKAIAKKTAIDPVSPESLPYKPVAGSEKEVRYLACDVLDYLERLHGAVDRSFLRTARGDDPAMRGFQSWVSMGSASETWTFCVQPDGRPLDLAEAIATDRLTDDTVALTIAEFSERLGHAAKQALAMKERTTVARATRKPAAVAKDRKDRWKKAGGPI